jgi:hypothetical protein
MRTIAGRIWSRVDLRVLLTVGLALILAACGKGGSPAY